MTIPERTVSEMRLRSAKLQDELAEWKDRATANIDQFGRHKSQMIALGNLMDGLLKTAGSKVDELEPAQPGQKFSRAYNQAVKHIIGSHEVWRVFRTIFNQLQDPHLGALLDDANWVAADCYLAWLDRCRFLGILPESQFREPPLVYLEAQFSAATANRGVELSELRFSVNPALSFRLPIPVVVLPYDHVGLIWLLTNLSHEAGHNLDQDLQLHAELAGCIDDALAAAGTPKPRREVWMKWTQEILADALGVLSNGAGFAHTLASFLYVLAPVRSLVDENDTHPDHYVRMFLLADLLEQTGVQELMQSAADLRLVAGELTPLAGSAEYIAECPLVAKVCLSQPLQALKDKPLMALAPALEEDARQTAKLAKYFRTGSGFDKPTAPAPARLVPAAAGLCLAQMEAADEQALERLQERAVAYLRTLPRPEFLAGADRSAFLDQLAASIDFSEENV
jgi:hypothetical protein